MYIYPFGLVSLGFVHLYIVPSCVFFVVIAILCKERLFDGQCLQH